MDLGKDFDDQEYVNEVHVNEVHVNEVHPSVINLPISIGDSIFEVKEYIKTCRYFGDEYAAEDGYPNCAQHEYDCICSDYDLDEYAEPCDAVYDYMIGMKKIYEWEYSICAERVARGKPALAYNEFLTRQEAEKYIEETRKKRNEQKMQLLQSFQDMRSKKVQSAKS